MANDHEEFEMIEFVESAINHTESTSTEANRIQKRIQLAAWLRDSHKISLKGEVVVSPNDGKAYMIFEYLSEDGEVKESVACIDKWQDRFVNEMKKECV